MAKLWQLVTVYWSESLRISSSIALLTESSGLWIREPESSLTCSGALFCRLATSL
jgi:hypothetical protein